MVAEAVFGILLVQNRSLDRAAANERIRGAGDECFLEGLISTVATVFAGCYSMEMLGVPQY